MKKPRLRKITPLVPVMNIAASVKFFETTLGFQPQLQTADYAYIRRDDVALRLQCVGDSAKIGETACYIDTENIDALYRALKPKLDLLPSGRVRPPFNQPYGMREFHVTDPDNLLIFFGEPLKKSRA